MNYEIKKPLPIPELQLKPDISTLIKLNEEMIQTLTLLTAYDGAIRRMIRCTLTGSLYTAPKPATKIYHETGSGANDVITFGNVPTTEVLIMAYPTNSSKVWAAIGETPTTANGWPLDSGDSVSLALSNLSQLQLLIVGDGEIAILAYTE